MRSSDTARERLTLFADLFVRAAVDHIEFYGMTLDFWAAAGAGTYEGRFREAFQQGYGQMRGLVAGTLREGLESGEFREGLDPEAMAVMIVGALDALVLQYWLEPGIDPEYKVRHFFDTLMSGLAVETAPGETGKAKRRNQ
jgi:hypothetical protein